MDIGQGIERSLPEQIPVLPNLVTSNSHYMMQNPNFIIRWFMQQRFAEIPAQFTLSVLVQTHMDMERDIEIPVPPKTHMNKKSTTVARPRQLILLNSEISPLQYTMLEFNLINNLTNLITGGGNHNQLLEQTSLFLNLGISHLQPNTMKEFNLINNSTSLIMLRNAVRPQSSLIL